MLKRILLIYIFIFSVSSLSANESIAIKIVPVVNYLLSEKASGTGSPVGVDPVPPFSSFGSFNNGEVPLITISLASGFDGDIEAAIINEEISGASIPTQNYALINGVTSMNVVNVKSTNAFVFDCPNSGYNAEGVVTYDFVTGVEVASVTINEETYNCTSTYANPLPLTISNSESIDSLLQDWPSDDPISTNCPEEAVVDPPGDFISCNSTELTNSEVVDDNGKTHLISTQSSVQL